ncbi:hypothetical protein MAMMFC1_01318 [Methylomusa anaerophila]|uniref:Uncharacterized protein n=1 Tax=Methylomusa anaerophila TaxID=1930071 RepID=A0A348AHV9_9FIRM|nr:hypothetical protein MAMMFC1_01318 [Methylomusa anaerophila]
MKKYSYILYISNVPSSPAKESSVKTRETNTCQCPQVIRGGTGFGVLQARNFFNLRNENDYYSLKEDLICSWKQDGERR